MATDYKVGDLTRILENRAKFNLMILGILGIRYTGPPSGKSIHKYKHVFLYVEFPFVKNTGSLNIEYLRYS